ncbi:unnamed protein product [Caenorhabditis brenneri]
MRIDLAPLHGDFGDSHISSSYETVQEVTELLEAKLTKTKQPENIHGGGFLKYCLLKKLREVMVEGFLRTFERGHHHQISAKPFQRWSMEILREEIMLYNPDH